MKYDSSGFPMASSQISSYSKDTLKESTMSIPKNTIKDETIQRKVMGKLNLELK